MELRQIRYFCQACKDGSYTAAADKLFVTEQTISSAIKKLEKELECDLLARGKTGVSPTPAGEILFEKGVKVLELVDDVVKAIGKRRNEQVTLRFDIVTFGIPERENFSTQAIDAFCSLHPQFEIDLSEHSSEKCIEHVLEGVAALGLVYDTVSEPELDALHLFDEPIVFVLATDHPLAGKTRLTFEDLEGQTILTSGQGGFFSQLLEQRGRELGFVPKLQTVSAVYYFDMATAGKGIAPALAHHPMLENRPGLIELPLYDTATNMQVTTPVNLVLRHNRRPSSPVRMLADWLLKTWGAVGE